MREQSSTAVAGPRPSHVRTAGLLFAGGLLFLAITAIGGYGLGWRWTGFQSNPTLWDWLNLVLLPFTVATLPLWQATRLRRQRIWRLIFWVLALTLLLLVIGGYGAGWRWTGFAGNTLWDWLKLLLVPFVLPLAVLWLQRGADNHTAHADQR